MRRSIKEPDYDNSEDSEFSDGGSHYSNDYIKKKLKASTYKILNRDALNKNNELNKYQVITKSPQKQKFESQYDDLTYDNTKKPDSYVDKDNYVQDNRYSNIENNMTYSVVKECDFKHNNMIPYFKRGIGKGYGNNSIAEDKYNQTNQRRLDLYSGSIKNLDYRQKVEQRPLFEPTAGQSWIYGMPTVTDGMEDRFIPSRFKENEFIVEPERVGPGLGLGYNELSKEGYNNGLIPRVLPKTIDQIRTASNQRISYGTQIIPGMKGQKSQTRPNVVLKKPPTWYLRDWNNVLPTGGEMKAPRYQGEIQMNMTERVSTANQEWIGPVDDSGTGTTGKLISQQKIGTKRTVNNDYIGGLEAANNGGYQVAVQNTQADNTLRQTVQNNVRNGNLIAGEQGGYKVAVQNTQADNTLRQTVQNNVRNGNLVAGEQGGYKVAVQNTQADNTLRQTVQNNIRNGNLVAGEQGGYKVAVQNTQADNTLRQTVQNNIRNGNLVAGEQGGYKIAVQNTQADNTLRQTVQNNIRNGNLVAGEQGGYKVAVQNTQADNTLRQTVQNNIRNGNLTAGEKGAYQVTVQNTQADNTLRQAVQNNVRNGNLVAGEQGGYKVAVQNTQAPNTKKQTTQNVTHIGNLTAGENGAYQVVAQNTQADNTLRQTVQNNIRNGNIVAGEQGGYKIAVQNTQADNTLRQTVQNNTRNGVVSAGEKGGYQVVAQNTQAPNTKKQTTQNNTRNGVVTAGEKGGYQVVAQNTVADNTLRQTTQNITKIGPLQCQEKGGYNVANQNTKAENTLKQVTQNVTRIGPAGSNRDASYVVNQKNTVAPDTLRQASQNVTYIGPMLANVEKERTREDVKNMRQNYSRDELTIVRDGGRPTNSGVDKGPNSDYTVYKVIQPLNVVRELYPDATDTATERMPINLTRKANIFPQITRVN